MLTNDRPPGTSETTCCLSRHCDEFVLALFPFLFFRSLWRRHVANLPLPHHGWQPPADPGADGGERALPAHPPPVCQTAAGGRRRQVPSGNCQRAFSLRLCSASGPRRSCCFACFPLLNQASSLGVLIISIVSRMLLELVVRFVIFNSLSCSLFRLN